MIIRSANQSDIKAVKELVETLQVTRDQENWQTKKSGLFEYPKSEQELLEAINPYFVVAETLEGIRGYSLSYDSNFFRRMNPDAKNLEYRFLLDLDSDFLYIDQLGVLNPNSLGSGRISNALADTCLDLAREKGLQTAIAYICEKPLFNERSHKFMTRKGFRKFHNVPIENGIVLGAYQLQLKS